MQVGCEVMQIKLGMGYTFVICSYECEGCGNAHYDLKFGQAAMSIKDYLEFSLKSYKEGQQNVRST